MIALDEDALICDFAETYHVFDYKALTVELAATLAAGLRQNSRIRLKASGLEVDINTLLLARIADSTAYNFYAKTKDAKYGRNMPKSMVEALSKHETRELKHFDNGAAFMREWRKLNGDRVR